MIGVAGREHHPNKLSRGEQQRVTIAKALVNDSAIIFADNAKCNLNTKAAEDIMSLFTGCTVNSR